MLEQQADADQLMGAFRASFPQEWAQFKTESAADIKSSISVDEIKTRAAARMRSFTIEHIAWTAAAPSSELNAALAAERAFIDQLANDSVEVCARFGMSGLNGSETLSETAYRLLNEAGAKKILATRRGRDEPQNHGEVTAEDADSLIAQMTAAGASERVIELMLTDASLGNTSEQCDGTVALYRAMDQMSDEQAARVYATVLLGAAAAQGAESP
jgi:hypothetical protein